MHTHGPRRGVRGVRVCACETIVPPSNTAHPPAHPSSQLPSHTTSKSSTAGCFITLENSQANPYVAGKEPWPKAGDPAGNFQGCTFLLVLLTKAKPRARHREGKVHAHTPSTVFYKQQITEAWGSGWDPGSATICKFAWLLFQFPVLMDGNKLPVLLH